MTLQFWHTNFGFKMISNVSQKSVWWCERLIELAMMANASFLCGSSFPPQFPRVWYSLDKWPENSIIARERIKAVESHMSHRGGRGDGSGDWRSHGTKTLIHSLRVWLSLETRTRFVSSLNLLIPPSSINLIKTVTERESVP